MYVHVVMNITEAQYQDLKFILEQEHCKEFPMEDVREIAEELVILYLLLSKKSSQK